MFNSNNKRFVFFYTFLLLSLFILYAIAYKVQLGSHVKAEWWINNICDYQDYVSSTIEEPKIIIAGGSNGLFGLDRTIIKDITGYEVLNLSTHRLMDISFIYYRIKEHIQKGDIVVLPLEFVFYKRNQQSSWFTSNMMAWGEERYLKKLSFYEYLSFLLRVEESRVIDGFFQREREVPNFSKNEAIEQLSSLLESEGPKWRKYSFKSLDKYGNINVNKKPEEKIVRRYKAGISFFKKEVIISDHFLLYHSRMSDLVAQYQGKLVLTWPVTLRNKKFDLSKPEHQKKVDAFRKKLENRGINIRFNPALFNLGLNFFFNSEYHANKNGAAIRSENLAHCLNSLIEQGNSNDISYDEAIQTVRAQESIYNLKYDLNNTRP